MSNTIDFGLLGVGKSIQFGKGGNRLASNAGVFSAFAPDGTTLARLQVADPVSPSDAVTFRTLQSLTSGSGTTAANVQNVRTVIGSATMLSTDGILYVQPTAPCTIALEASPQTGVTHIVKDGNRTAASNTITIVAASGGTIEGAASFPLNFNGGSVSLVFTGQEWSIV